MRKSTSAFSERGQRRLMGNIHETDEMASIGVKSKSWDIPIEDDHRTAFHDDLRAASGVGRRRIRSKVCVIK